MEDHGAKAVTGKRYKLYQKKTVNRQLSPPVEIELCLEFLNVELCTAFSSFNPTVFTVDT